MVNNRNIARNWWGKTLLQIQPLSKKLGSFEKRYFTAVMSIILQP
jgi:hypothetical protein